MRFVSRLTRIRRTFPILRRERFLTGDYNEDLQLKELTWLNPSGTEMSDENWNDKSAKCMGLVLDGRAQPTGIRRRGIDRTLLLVLNAHSDVVNFTLPPIAGGKGWLLMVDTNQPDLAGEPQFAFQKQYASARTRS